MQVHDELVLEAPVKEKEEVMTLVKKEMEEVIKLKVPLKVEIASWEELGRSPLTDCSTINVTSCNKQALKSSKYAGLQSIINETMYFPLLKTMNSAIMIIKLLKKAKFVY